MTRIIYIILLLIGFTDPVSAFPISPKPLRQLVKESEFIVVGYVVKTYDRKKDTGSWGTRVASVAVLENLKGKVNDKTIEIFYSPDMVSPEPACYFDSTFVIAFLDIFKGSYVTHALSYGAKTLHKEEIEIYKKRIAEMQSILSYTDKEKQLAATVEWLVTCAENETTRWEGSFELSPESSPLSFYSRDKHEDFSSRLTAEQKERLKKALLSSGKVLDFGLADLVYKGNEKEIDLFLINRLRSLQEDNYWMAIDFMNRLKHKNNSEEMTVVLAEFDKVKFNFDKINEMKILMDRFIKLVDQ